MSDLKVAIVQQNPEWENREENLVHYTSIIRNIGQTDLILLPEMFTTGFSMSVETMAETMEGRSVEWMRSQSQENKAALAGTLIIKENGVYYNRMVWADPTGEIQYYDKRHLFSMGEEHLHYTAGDKRVTINFKGWRIRPLICYDLRFPVWSRNHDDYDLLIYLANWPSARHQVWKSLLVARALENQCWCAGVNRTGTDGMNILYGGDSGIIDPRGMATWMGDNSTAQIFSLSLDELRKFRQKFPVLNDRDNFDIRL
jgi:omega-amidase